MNIEINNKVLKELFYKSTAAIAILNEEGKYIAQNEVHKEIFGYLDEDIKGNTSEIHLGEKLAKILDDINKKGYFSGEIQFLTKDGRFLTLWLNAYKIEVDGKKYYICLPVLLF